jgi:hypothetical protein
MLRKFERYKLTFGPTYIGVAPGLAAGSGPLLQNHRFVL